MDGFRHKVTHSGAQELSPCAKPGEADALQALIGRGGLPGTPRAASAATPAGTCRVQLQLLAAATAMELKRLLSARAAWTGQPTADLVARMAAVTPRSSSSPTA